MTEKQADKTALSYWFSIIEAAGLPVPRTIIIDMPLPAQRSVWGWFDGNDGTPDEEASLQEFLGKLSEAVRQVGLPAFLRTDHTSAKHNWEKTCYITSDDPEYLGAHVFAIAEFSEIVGMMGDVPWTRWAVREFLPTMPLGKCRDYGDMPLCREFRFFVDNGVVRCVHPYWPAAALEQGGADPSLFDELRTEPAYFWQANELAMATGKALGGSWSIDILETKRGWFVTDLAEASKSFHWEGCPHA